MRIENETGKDTVATSARTVFEWGLAGVASLGAAMRLGGIAAVGHALRFFTWACQAAVRLHGLADRWDASNRNAEAGPDASSTDAAQQCGSSRAPRLEERATERDSYAPYTWDIGVPSRDDEAAFGGLGDMHVFRSKLPRGQA